MSWLYGKPITGDIRDFRLVRMSFCEGHAQEHIMHKDHVARFVEASVKLHHTPGINPATKGKTAPIWRIESAPLHTDTYWWATPSLDGRDEDAGAAIVRNGPFETLFVDQKYVDRINRQEHD
nr:Unknown Function [uncultured bacterium]